MYFTPSLSSVCRAPNMQSHCVAGLADTRKKNRHSESAFCSWGGGEAMVLVGGVLAFKCSKNFHSTALLDCTPPSPLHNQH